MTLAAQITDTGISAPSYAEILTSLTESFQSIFGSDAYLGADSQDGQLLAVVAQAIHESNQTAVKAYQDRSPSFAQGVGLDSVVAINGITRRPATNSTVNVTVAGTVGTTINNGVAQDASGNRWDLPASVTIPLSGEIVVTATAQEAGAITATAASVTQINTPTLGWQTVTNAAPATAGADMETDAQLRVRQAASVSLPSRSILDALIAAVAAVSGVTRSRIYENDTGSTDGDGIPAHSVSPVVEGGIASEIGAAVALVKPPGIQTYGTTSVTVTDDFGLPRTVNFYALTSVPIYVTITISALTGFTSATSSLIQNAVMEWINSLDIGEDVYYNKLFGPANLSGDAATLSSGLTQEQLDVFADTFTITDMRIGLAATPTGTANLAIAFNAAATTLLPNIVIVGP